MAVNRGVSLRELKTLRRRYWRDEAQADGGKRHLRRVVRHAGERRWRREWGIA